MNVAIGITGIAIMLFGVGSMHYHCWGQPYTFLMVFQYAPLWSWALWASGLGLYFWSYKRNFK
jgi:hypothetical protein